jgi:hypothetical protein
MQFSCNKKSIRGRDITTLRQGSRTQIHLRVTLEEQKMFRGPQNFENNGSKAGGGNIRPAGHIRPAKGNI